MKTQACVTRVALAVGSMAVGQSQPAIAAGIPRSRDAAYAYTEQSWSDPDPSRHRPDKGWAESCRRSRNAFGAETAGA